MSTEERESAFAIEWRVVQNLTHSSKHQGEMYVSKNGQEWYIVPVHNYAMSSKVYNQCRYEMYCSLTSPEYHDSWCMIYVYFFPYGDSTIFLFTIILLILACNSYITVTARLIIGSIFTNCCVAKHCTEPYLKYSIDPRVSKTMVYISQRQVELVVNLNKMRIQWCST